MAKSQPDINSSLSWIGTILQYLKEYGGWNILKSIGIMFVLITTLRICYNPSFLFERYKEFSEIQHSKEQACRIKNDDNINKCLPSIMVESRASRVWVIQYHNGVSDWSYGSMRFELTLDSVKSIQNQYDDFHLSWLKLPMYLREHQYFIGTTEELGDVDHIIHDRFLENNIAYSACILIRHNNVESGVLGITWEHTPEMSKQDILLLLERYAGKLEEFLIPQIKKL